MKLIYKGQASVEVPDLGLVVSPGETIDIPEPLAEALLAQGFKRAPAKESE